MADDFYLDITNRNIRVTVFVNFKWAFDMIVHYILIIIFKNNEN